MWFGRSEEEVRRLEDEAHQHLAEGRADEALALAEQLLDMGWSGGFELEALALVQLGQPERAVEVVEGAVAKLDGPWPLWLLLGNLRSDLERFDEAIEAFERAASFDDASQNTVRFNRAVTRHRMGEPGRALADLDPILALPKPPAMAEDALGLAAECLAEIGRAEEGLGLVRAAVEACADDDPRRPRLEVEHALALERSDAPQQDVLDAFERAAATGLSNERLFALGRRLSPVLECGVRYRLVVDGPAPPGWDAKGFLRFFEIVAADPDAALEEARRFVPHEVRDGLRIESCDVLEPSCDAGAGVWAASGNMFYGEP